MALTTGQADNIAKGVVAGFKGRNYTLEDIELIMAYIRSNVDEEKGKLEL